MDREEIRSLLTTANVVEFAAHVTDALNEVTGTQFAVSYCADISSVHSEFCNSWVRVGSLNIKQEHRENIRGFSDETFNAVRRNYRALLDIFLPHRPDQIEVRRECIFWFCCDLEKEKPFELVELDFPSDLGELEAKKLVNLALEHGFLFTINPQLGEIIDGVFLTRTEIRRKLQWELEERVRKIVEELPSDPTIADRNMFDHWSSKKD